MRVLSRLAFACALLVMAGAATKLTVSPPRPWLGVGIERGTVGVRVNEVIDGSPADAVGIRFGDQIVAVAGTAVRTPDELVAAIGNHAIGTPVEMKVVRAGRRLTLKPQLSAMLDDHEILQRRLVDKPAPRFRLPVVGGTDESMGDLDDHRGKVVVIEFLASWCQPCKSTYQPLTELAAAHRGDIVVIGISAEPEATIRKFLGRYQLGFPVLRDDGARVRWNAYRSNKTPTLVVIDRDGLIRYAGIGADLNLDNALFHAERAARERL